MFSIKTNKWRRVLKIILALVVILTIYVHCYQLLAGKRLGGRRHVTLNKNQTSCSQKQRTFILERACADEKHTGDANAEPSKHMLVDDRHKLLYCDVAKSGSSAWLTALVQASGVSSVNSDFIHSPTYLASAGLKRLQDYSQSEQDYRLDKYFKFIVVRHPFDRFFSTWRDKIKTKAFSVMNILSQYQHRRRPALQNISYPLFSEFADYLAVHKWWDYHWVSYAEFCHPCQVQWDAILKLETTQHDSSLVLNKLNMTSLPVVHSHQSTESRDQMWKFLPEYGTLESRALQYLHRLYDLDLRMFGYSWQQDTHTAACGVEEDGACC